jgi:pimeloyl-ACP methyl ester carboxylesterase
MANSSNSPEAAEDSKGGVEPVTEDHDERRTQGERGLAPVTHIAGVVRGELSLHGRRVSYLAAGHEGPVLVLVHGLGGSAAAWRPVMGLLGRAARVIAPDLLGHGGSAAPASGDYSPAGHATWLRDLLRKLDLDEVTVVGHSFGGGVAMQFAYQYPERVQRLVLVASGGLGPEVSIALRAACLPGAAAVVWVLAAAAPTPLGAPARRIAVELGFAARAEIDALANGLATLADPAARTAFLHTVRFALGPSGQRLDARSHLHLLDAAPVLLVAGRNDACIPVRHSLAAHRLLPGSRLAVIEAGHFPHLEQPENFTRVLLEFLAATPAAGEVGCGLRGSA